MAEGTELDEWKEAGRTFVEHHYASLRGRLRTKVIDRHLHEHLDPAPRQVVDVGGGAGHQSIPLAREGYGVTIVDPSPSMLERAAERLADEPADVAERVRLVQAPGERAPEALDHATFDVVLCHGVLMYLDEPTTMLEALARLAAPGALTSVVATNVHALAVRPALEGDWEQALSTFDAEHTVNRLGLVTRGDDVDELARLLAQHGVDPLAWYGVRLFTDGWLGEHTPVDREDLALEVELEASRRDPYRRLSRLFHLLGRARPAR